MSETTAVTAPESAGHLPPALMAALEARKAANIMASKIAETNWGKALDLPTRRAVSEWGLRHNVDVTTEIDVLGGRVYLNAAFYLRKLAGMVAAGLVDYAFPDFVQADKRLDDHDADWARIERDRRIMERIKWGVPENAAAACVFRVRLKSMNREIVGVNWCGGGVRKGDPVGDAEPAKTAATRAARRAMRQITTHITETARAIAEAEAEAVQVGIVIDEETQRVESQIAENNMVGRKALKGGTTGDPFAEDRQADQELNDADA